MDQGQVLSTEDLTEQIHQARAEFEQRFLVLASTWGTDTLRTEIKTARELANPDGGSAAAFVTGAQLTCSRRSRRTSERRSRC